MSFGCPSGALKLRDHECKATWSAAAALAKALVYGEKMEMPRWAEALQRPRVALGLARWYFSGVTMLPRLFQRNAAGEEMRVPTALPKRGDVGRGDAYWAHFDWLEEQSKERQRRGKSR